MDHNSSRQDYDELSKVQQREDGHAELHQSQTTAKSSDGEHELPMVPAAL